MDRVDPPSDEAPVVGVVGADPAALEPVVERVGDVQDDATSVTVTGGTADAVLEAAPSFVVAVGDAALCSIARRSPSVPVLPVGVDGVRSVPRNRLASSLRAVIEGDATARPYPLLAVECDRPTVDPGRALFDVTLVTAEPARISEYAVVDTGADEVVARFRADGVVAATPAGSHGYANAVTGPVVSESIDGLAVVPIAPFVTSPDRWLLPGPVELSVERDESDVSLCVDDRTVGRLTGADTVSVAFDPDGSLSVLVTADSRGNFD